MQAVPASRQNRGGSKGVSPLAHDFATQSVVCFIRSVSVAVKIPLPLGGQGHLKRRENRAVFVWRGATSAGLVSSAGRAYMTPAPRPIFRFVEKVFRSCGHTPGKVVGQRANIKADLISFSIYRRVLHNASVLISAMFHTNTMFLILVHQSCILDLSHYETSTILYAC